MPALLAKSILGLLQLALVMGLVLFAGAGTLGYWQGWAFLAAFFLPCAYITAHLYRHDRALLRRRLAAGPVAEKDRRQKRIQALAASLFLAILLVPALDRRFGWSRVPGALVWAGDALAIAALAAILAVYRANSFTSAVVEVHAGQAVASTGPYAWMRHPMYAAAILLFLAIPLALGSWWGLLGVPGLIGVVALRLLAEEALLRRDLPGYADYCERVRYRLVPGMW